MNRIDFFDSGPNRLSCVCTVPDSREIKAGLIFVHAADGNRLGPHRMFVELAEELKCPLDAIEDTSILAEPVQIGHLHTPNSLAVHPMEGCDGLPDGKPGKLTLRRYRRFAAGGAGLIWAEAMAVVPEARANPRQLWLHEGSKAAIGEMVSMMRRVAAESMGNSHKPVIVAQLTHSGRYSKPEGKAEPLIPQRDPYRDVLAPEPVPSTTRDSKIGPDYPIVTDEYLDQLLRDITLDMQLALEEFSNRTAEFTETQEGTRH